MSVFFTDTDCEMSYSDAESLGMKVIGMPYTIKGQEYVYDFGKDIDIKAFYNQMRDGEIVTYREKDHDFLMEIRNGKYLDENRQPIPEFFDIVEDLEARLDTAKQTTTLPENPDYKKINEFVASVNERIVRGEI